MQRSLAAPCMQIKLTVAIVLIILLVIFFFQNLEPQTLHFLFWERKITLAALIGISTAIGFGLGLIVPRLLREREEHHELRRNKEMQEDKEA